MKKQRITTVLKSLPQVENFVSNSGNAVENQFKIYFNGGVLFKSYSSNIAVKMHDGRVFLDEKKWDYSKTTGKYRNLFLRETKKETEAKIDSGRYILTDLNP